MAWITSAVRVAFMFALLLALAACGGREPPPEGEDEAALAAMPAPPDEEAFVRTWQGVLPCSDCAGIQTRLTLRRDGEGNQDYDLEETYLGAAGDNVFTTSGPWRRTVHRGEAGPVPVFRVDPDGADQRFELQPDGSLELLGPGGRPRPDGIGHRLQRL